MLYNFKCKCNKTLKMDLTGFKFIYDLKFDWVCEGCGRLNSVLQGSITNEN